MMRWNQDGWQAIHIATANGQVDVIKTLVDDFDVDANSQSEVSNNEVVNMHVSMYL